MIPGARWGQLAGAIAMVALAAAQPARAQSGENVLVVANGDSAASGEIADYYAVKRGVPADQVVRISLADSEEVQRPVYDAQIERPIANWLKSHGAQDRILYIVLTKGVPLRVAGGIGLNGTVASVDSELTLLYRKFTGASVSVTGSIKNPYFLGDAAVSDAQRFSHKKQDIYLVSRLDGYTVDDVKGVIDRGRAPSNQGVVLLDEKAELVRSPGNTWLEKASANLKKIDGWADRVVLDPGVKVLQDQANVIGYYSWGSNDSAIQTRQPNLQFVPGALAAMFVSTDGRTFVEPPAQWQVGKSNYRGTSQSLIGDLIRAGATGVAGHVAEPYLNGTIRPDVLFPAYAAGFNLVEAFYLAMPFVSWQTVVIGDPLCAPFKGPSLVPEEIDPGLDAATGLPSFLSQRRVAAVVEAGAKIEAARLLTHADVLLTKQDRAGARQALERATALDEAFVPARLALANIYELLSEWDAAINEYRRILSRAPNNVVALNNLAYGLAVHRQAPAEALPLAKRAFVALKGAPAAADTLGWVYHLLGNDAEAAPLLASAANGDPTNTAIQIHAAIALAATGQNQAAARLVTRAVTLDNSLETREDVAELRKRLQLP